MHKYLGMEPSGRKFNDMELDYNHQPHNPMVNDDDSDDDGVDNDDEDNIVDYQVNAGAILTVSLLQRLIQPQMSMAEKFDYILDYFTR